MVFRLFLKTVSIMTVLASCASAPSIPADPQSAKDENLNVYPTIKRWTGTLNPTQSYNGSAVASQRQNAYGRLELTTSPNSPTLSRVVITVSVPTDAAGAVLGWGLSQGRCGSGNPPVLSPSAFPVIQVSASGHGTVDTRIPFIIPDNGDYHINVFRGSGVQLSNVMTCGDLRRES